MSGFQNQGRGAGRTGRGGEGGFGGRGLDSGRGGGRSSGRGEGSFEGGRGSGRGDGRGFGRGEGGGRSGDGGGRGGGRGGQLKMNETGTISTMYRSSVNFTDRSILAIINPPMAQRDRSGLVARSGENMPSLDPQRLENKAGVEIAAAGGALAITSNHFAVNASGVPLTITQYDVCLQKILRSGDAGENVSERDDIRKTLQVVKTLIARHPAWSAAGLGVAYNSAASMYTTRPLPGINTMDTQGRLFVSEVVGLLNKDGTESTQAQYVVTLTEVGRNLTGREATLALENALLMYGRWDATLDAPTWVMAKNRIFTATEKDAFSLSRSGHILAKQGWYASLKQCVHGSFLVVDLAVNAVLASGFMPELMSKAAGFSNFNDFYAECTRGLKPQYLRKIVEAIKKIRVRVVHLGFAKVAKHLGPAANSPQSGFEHEGKKYTVEQYYALKARSDPRYKAVKYPFLPTVNMGSNTRKELYPAELVLIPPGEMRNHLVKEDPMLNAAMIRHAAVKPSERMNHIINSPQSVVKVLRQDATAKAFGLHQIALTPTQVPATMLPPAKLQYGKDHTSNPEFSGEWNPSGRDKVTFLRPPANPLNGGYMFAVLVVGNAHPSLTPVIDAMCAELIRQSSISGVKLIKGGSGSFLTSDGSPADLTKTFTMLQSKGARIVITVLIEAPDHGSVKLAADILGLPTQCIKLATLEKNPRGVYSNLMIKINAKLGGTNHTLKSRLEPKDPAMKAPVFQSPPASLSWIFDKPCMLVGIDVSHPEPGAERPSMAAVVGSVDRSATKYVAHISAQTSRQEMVGDLTTAMGCLLTSFRKRNNKAMPETILVYCDGVSEGQYAAVLRDELPQIREAIALQGYTEDAVKIAIVICTKGHNTRLVAQEHGGEMMNVCSGLVVDSVITSPTLNEFYLNSHAAIQGTSKPCRYTLLYDAVGFKMSELQLLTYWTTFLYSRCDRAVSYATPAYYAHWASKRAKDLLAAGAGSAELQAISDVCSRDESSYNMFFL